MPNPKVHAGPQRDWILPIGAQPEPDGVRFRVWAPRADDLQVELEGGRRASLTPEGDGYYSGTIGGLGAGTRYRYVIGGEGFPDPASRWQPDGVHGPSAVVEPDAFEWSDDQWRGLSLGELILYELHVGTCTADGTFAALIPYLSHLKRLGITAIELMPVAQFPGRRNWGYDGVGLYAPQNSYGGPDRLKHLVDAAHRMGLGVFLDVVYNHVGPEGNYLDQYGPYFTEAYRTPWGRAVNYDGADSDAVRAFVVENARYWVHEYHLDGLRLDAIHGIFDFSARHILAELTEAVHADAARLGRSVLVIAESDLNDPRVIRPRGSFRSLSAMTSTERPSRAASA